MTSTSIMSRSSGLSNLQGTTQVVMRDRNHGRVDGYNAKGRVFSQSCLEFRKCRDWNELAGTNGLTASRKSLIDNLIPDNAVKSDKTESNKVKSSTLESSKVESNKVESKKSNKAGSNENVLLCSNIEEKINICENVVKVYDNLKPQLQKQIFQTQVSRNESQDSLNAEEYNKVTQELWALDQYGTSLKETLKQFEDDLSFLKQPSLNLDSLSIAEAKKKLKDYQALSVQIQNKHNQNKADVEQNSTLQHLPDICKDTQKDHEALKSEILQAKLLKISEDCNKLKSYIHNQGAKAQWY